jgi:hypothetical protein
MYLHLVSVVSFFRFIMAGYKKLDAMIETVQEERSGKS